MNRNKLLELRPEIPAIDQEIASNEAERFQNQSLRPILKFQNHLLLSVFRQYAKERKSVFFELSPPKQRDYIAHSLQKDQKLRNLMFGLIIGLMTEEEYTAFARDQRELRKRIISMLSMRLQDQLVD